MQLPDVAPNSVASLPDESAVGLREDARHLQEALHELMRVVQFRDRDRLCAYDVTVSQCYALKAIADAGSLTVNELAAELYLDKSTASRLANTLMAKGYISKEPDPEDRRLVRMVPTRAGRVMARRIEADLLREHMSLLEDFDPDVRRAMTRLVARLSKAVASRVEASGGSCCCVD